MTNSLLRLNTELPLAVDGLRTTVDQMTLVLSKPDKVKFSLPLDQVGEVSVRDELLFQIVIDHLLPHREDHSLVSELPAVIKTIDMPIERRMKEIANDVDERASGFRQIAEEFQQECSAISDLQQKGYQDLIRTLSPSLTR